MQRVCIRDDDYRGRTAFYLDVLYRTTFIEREYLIPVFSYARPYRRADHPAQSKAKQAV